MKRAKTDNDKAKRVESILKAALNEFAKSGVDATRMDDIAKTADVSKGTLYLYFKSKEALFSALVSDYASSLVRQVVSGSKSETDCRKALRQFVNAMSQVLVEKELAKIIPLLIANAHRTPHIVSDYQHNIVEVGLPLVINLLQDGVNTGVFREHNSQQYAALVIAPALQAVIFQTLFAQDKPLQQQEVRALLNLQLDMVFSHLERQND